MSAECRGVFEDVIIAGCQAALRFFMFPSGCVFDAEAERQTDSVTAVQKSKKKNSGGGKFPEAKDEKTLLKCGNKTIPKKAASFMW